MPRSNSRNCRAPSCAGSSWGGGAPPVAADEIVDLACFAAERGRTALLEVLDRGSSEKIRMIALGLAASALKGELENLLNGLAAFFDAKGIRHEMFQVEVGTGGRADD